MAEHKPGSLGTLGAGRRAKGGKEEEKVGELLGTQVAELRRRGFVFPSGKKKCTDIIEMLVTCTFHGKLIIQLHKRKILQKA